MLQTIPTPTVGAQRSGTHALEPTILFQSISQILYLYCLPIFQPSSYILGSSTSILWKKLKLQKCTFFIVLSSFDSEER